MTGDEFEDRVALLEEHLVRPSAADALARAEQHLANGDLVFAGLALETAKLRRYLDEWKAELDESEDGNA